MPTTRRAWLTAGLAALAARPAAAIEPLPIGALFAFSGGLSLLGDESFRGLDMAADERNAGGGLLGRPIALLRGDASDGPRAAAEAKRLLDAGKIAMMFGSSASAVSFAASAVTELDAVAYFELDAPADPITERGFRFLFRSCAPASACGMLAADAVADLLAPAWPMPPESLKIALLHDDELAGIATADAQQKRSRQRGLNLADRIGYVAGIMEFAPLVQRLRAAATDVVLHTGQVGDVVLFHRALKQAGWRPRMVIGCGGGYALNDTAQALGADFEGVMAVGVAPYRVSDIVAPGAGEVAAAYQRKYGAPPRSGHSLACFAGARLFFEAAQRAGSLDHDRLRAAVLATDLPAGSLVGGWGAKFDDKGQNVRAVPYVAQWQRGALVTIAPREAAVAALVPGLGS